MTNPRGRECAQREVAVGWALHALEPDEEASFAEHLPRCAECADRVSATEAITAALGAGVQQFDPPPRLRAAVLAAAGTPQIARHHEPPPEALAEVTPIAEPSALRGVTRARRVLVAAAMTGVLAFGAGWAGNALLQQPPNSTQSALPQLSDPSVRRTALVAQGSSTVMAVVLSDNSGATVVPVDMAPPPTGEAYWLWGTGAGAPVPLGRVTMGTGAAAQVQPQAGLTPARFTGYAVSVEPEAVVPVAPSTVVATSGTI